MPTSTMTLLNINTGPIQSNFLLMYKTDENTTKRSTAVFFNWLIYWLSLIDAFYIVCFSATHSLTGHNPACLSCTNEIDILMMSVASTSCPRSYLVFGNWLTKVTNNISVKKSFGYSFSYIMGVFQFLQNGASTACQIFILGVNTTQKFLLFERHLN